MSLYPILLHTVACIWYAFFWNKVLSNSTEDAEWHPQYRDYVELRWRYLTNWNLLLQTLYFSGCLLHDLMKILNGPNWLKLGTKFQTLLSGSFASILLPTGIYVSALFWILYGIDREFIYPKILDNVIPSWHNHGMHTVILPLVFAELMVTKHNFLPVTFLATAIFVCGFLYQIVFIGTYVEKGRWLYPIFNLFSFSVSIVLGIIFQIFSAGCLFVGIFIQNKFWGEGENKVYGETVQKSE